MENLKKNTKIRKLMISKGIQIRKSWKHFQNFDKRRAFNKNVGPGKKIKNQ